MEEDKNNSKIKKVSQQEIETCIVTLQNLLADTNQIFKLSKEKRKELAK